MRKLRLLLPGFLCFYVCGICPAQEIVTHEKLENKSSSAHLSRFGVGFKMSTLGAGVELATRMSSRSNLRAGFNEFIYERPFDADGLTYSGQFHLRSAQITYDWFPFGGRFHLSPGMLVYNGNRATADLSVPSSHVFTVDRNSFRSDPKDPIRGNASISFRTFAPAILFGWGNLVPRGHHRFSFPFEFGVVFHGQPNLFFSLDGKGCDSTGKYCKSINSDKSGRSYIAGERRQINSDIAPFKFYPVISGGFAFSF